MGEKWTCTVCGAAVAWGDPVCPLCGSALEWEETDDDDPVAHLMPPWWSDEESLAEYHGRQGRRYAVVVIGLGALASLLGLLSPLPTRWGFVAAGAAFVIGGAIGLLIVSTQDRPI
jgi:hypothetical protein